jgi:hypothetical protein
MADGLAPSMRAVRHAAPAGRNWDGPKSRNLPLWNSCVIAESFRVVEPDSDPGVKMTTLKSCPADYRIGILSHSPAKSMNE